MLKDYKKLSLDTSSGWTTPALSVFIGGALQTLDHLSGPPLNTRQRLHVFLVLGAPELNTALQVGLTRAEGQNHLS